MIIKFKKLSFKNILSFGAQETTIEFTKGINLITGKNGSGKSAILDALSFCLFGRPYRNIKINELINRKNKKEASVTCFFTIDNRDTYQITRSLNPSFLKIIKNGNEFDLLSSKKLNQEELNKIIGINYHLFKQVISLAVNYNKPFLSLSIQEKREIIEQIFNITVFGQMLKEAKKINADYIVKNEINKNLIKNLESNLSTLRKNLIEINKATINFENDKKEELKKINERISKYQEDIRVINSNLEENLKKIEAIHIDTVNNLIDENKNSLEKITKDINTKEYSINNYLNIIKNLETDLICPKCNTVLSKEHKENETKKLKEEIEKIQNELYIKINKKNEIKEQIEYFEKLKIEYDKLNLYNQTNIEKKMLIEKELLHLREDKKKVENKKMEINIESIKEEFDKKIKEYKIVFKNLSNINRILKNYELVLNILSESGIKSFFFKKLIPILNTKINEYLQMFEIPVVLLFNELMQEKITNYDNINNNVSYYSYSEGEKKRIDMSILLAFISITKAISNWNCNILLIDELLDGAIDEAGLDKLVTSLKNMTYDNDICIYIISHRLQQDYNSKFKTCLHIEKKDMFSKITYI